jgi:N-dimethylarginine dimethylaminohydrolase
MELAKSSDAAAYGGPGWSPRTTCLREEIGSLWQACGVASEWQELGSVLLHRPGAELVRASEPNAVQMLEVPVLQEAQRQHDLIARGFEQAGVSVHYVAPDRVPPPNLMFAADLFFMTPEGAVLGRPASTVRAGEERFVARRLADLGIPILRNIRGRGTFEGADAAWLDAETVLLATGLRTNPEGAGQVSLMLQEMGVEAIQIELPQGAMHLMGLLRFVDGNLAIAWPDRIPARAVEALQTRGVGIAFVPDLYEASQGQALNFVTLGPRRILMAGGNPNTQAFLEGLGIDCQTVVIDELAKAAGGIGCLSGILHRG